MSQIRTTEALEKVVEQINGNKILVVEDGFYNQSKPITVIGNATTEILPACPLGTCRKIKAICITGNGNAGTAKLLIGATVVLPVYFTVMSKGNTSPNLRLNVSAGETVTLVTADRGGTNETFVCITYYNTND